MLRYLLAILTFSFFSFASTPPLLPQTPDQYNLYVDNPDSSGPKVTINALTGVADQFTGSDALFNLFGYNGNARRYGDGAYETRLIREQIMRFGHRGQAIGVRVCQEGVTTNVN